MTAKEERDMLRALLKKAIAEFDELWVFRERAPSWVGRSHWYTKSRRHFGMKSHSASPTQENDHHG